MMIRKFVLRRVFILSAMSLGTVLFPTSGFAQFVTIYTVRTTSDTIVANACKNNQAGCSLRGAITEANASLSTIDIQFNIPACPGGVCTITLGDELPTITASNLSISGTGADRLIIKPATGVHIRVFNLFSPGGGTVTISNLTIRGEGNIGGILGGGIRKDGLGTLNVNGCLITNNRSDSGGGIGVNQGTVNVRNSTISGNQVSQIGGGILNTQNSTLNVINSTIHSNSAGGNGGGGIDNSGTLNITNSTIAGNSSNAGGGGVGSFGGTATVKNNIIAGNSAENSCKDVVGNFISAGFNLVGKRDCGNGFTNPTDLTGTIASPLNPLLDPAGLQNNGGPTPTIKLMPGSPAIDKATSLGLTGTLTTDQRGTGFPRTFNDPNVPNASGGDGTDIGAFEVQTAAPTPTPTPTPTPIPTPATVQFSAGVFTVNESDGQGTITVTRAGDTSSPAAVNYATSDLAGLQSCTIANGIASERCDYVTSVGTVRFAAGESSKTFIIPLIDDVWIEGPETFAVSLNSPAGATLGTQTSATITITDNDFTTPTSNPIDGVEFFIRQQYLDFLNRLPDQIGFQNWVNTLAPCPNGGFGEPPTSNCDRLHVASGFFQSDEFLNRGYFAFRFYMVSFNQRPTYAQFIPDMAQVGGPKSPAEEEAAKVAYAEGFVQRSEFLARYGGLSGQALANALTTNAGLPAFTVSGGMTNGQILRAIAERQTTFDRFLTEGTVSILYFGFMRRDPDATGFTNNVNTLNANPSNLRHMTFIFIYSTEYRQRFGP